MLIRVAIFVCFWYSAIVLYLPGLVCFGALGLLNFGFCLILDFVFCLF